MELVKSFGFFFACLLSGCSAPESYVAVYPPVSQPPQPPQKSPWETTPVPFDIRQKQWFLDFRNYQVYLKKYGETLPDAQRNYQELCKTLGVLKLYDVPKVPMITGHEETDDQTTYDYIVLLRSEITEINQDIADFNKSFKRYCVN